MKGLGSLGKAYADGEVIARQGGTAEVLYVVQEGRVEIVRNDQGKETRLTVAGLGEIVCEWVLFGSGVHPADVRALGPARVVSIRPRNLLRRMHSDPTLAFRLIETMSERIYDLTMLIAKVQSSATEK